MQIIDILKQAHGGTIGAQMALAAGVRPNAIDQALAKLVPLIASQIEKKCDEPGEFDDLLAVLESGDVEIYLDQPKALISKAAIEDGEDILSHVFGSVERARTMALSSGTPPNIDDDTYSRLMTMAATLVLAAMARRNQLLMNPVSANIGPQDGIISGIIGAIIEGLMQGLKMSVMRRRTRRSRRTTYGRKTTKRRRTTRRRKSTAAINDILGELFTGK